MPDPLDLLHELLCSLGGSRLERERTKPLPRLVLECPRLVDLDRDARELQLGAVATMLEAPETRCFLDQRTPLLGLGRQHLLDPSLADDRVHLVAEAGVTEQLEHVRAAHGRAIDQVLPVAASMEPARDRELAVRQRPVAGGVVEDHLDLAVIGTVAPGRARKEDVFRLLGPEGARRQAPGRPDDGVGDVRFPRAVRPDDDGHPRLEAYLDRVRERLEAAQLDRAQVHARISDDRCGRSVGLVCARQGRRQLPCRPPAILSSATIAAACSDAFFEGPVPVPHSSPSTTAAVVKLRACGGPSVACSA